MKEIKKDLLDRGIGIAGEAGRAILDGIYHSMNNY